MTARADALFELTDAVLCTEGPVKTLVDLSLAPEHRRGHGALYSALGAGGVDMARFRGLLAGQRLPRAADGRLMLAVDVSNRLRPDAATSSDRLFCHTYGRGQGQAQMIPGWPYSVIAALDPGRSSWTALLDAVRLGPACDTATVTAAQLREVVTGLIEAGQWRDGDANILIVADAGYDPARLAHALSDLPVEAFARLRSDRVFCRPVPARPRSPRGGRPAKHGGLFRFTDPETWHTPSVTTHTRTERYGTAAATAWNRMHPRLTHRSVWIDHDGELPVIAGTLIRLTVEYLPGDRHPKPVWLWTSAVDLPAEQVNRAWQAFLRCFDLEHTFRLLKQTLGASCPKLRDPESADRWTSLIIAAHAQLRLACPAASDLRRPWEKPVTEPGKLTPARVCRGFRNIRGKTPIPARAPKPSRPGPGRPPGTHNRHHATRHDVGKIPKRPASITAHRSTTG
nr:NF041680 family putative transposase [Sciscionella marina]